MEFLVFLIIALLTDSLGAFGDFLIALLSALSSVLQ